MKAPGSCRMRSLSIKKPSSCRTAIRASELRSRMRLQRLETKLTQRKSFATSSSNRRIATFPVMCLRRFTPVSAKRTRRFSIWKSLTTQGRSTFHGSSRPTCASTISVPTRGLRTWPGASASRSEASSLHCRDLNRTLQSANFIAAIPTTPGPHFVGSSELGRLPICY
jgi:hypothetical protein